MNAYYSKFRVMNQFAIAATLNQNGCPAVFVSQTLRVLRLGMHLLRKKPKPYDYWQDQPGNYANIEGTAIHKARPSRGVVEPIFFFYFLSASVTMKQPISPLSIRETEPSLKQFSTGSTILQKGTFPSHTCLRSRGDFFFLIQDNMLENRAIVYHPGRKWPPRYISSRYCNAVISITDLAELYNSLCHTGVTHMFYFVRTWNSPYLVEDVRQMTKACRLRVEPKHQFHKPVQAYLIGYPAI